MEDLPLLRTVLAIRQKSREPSFWEVMDSFVLGAYTSLVASRTLLQQLLACVSLTVLLMFFFSVKEGGTQMGRTSMLGFHDFQLYTCRNVDVVNNLKMILY